MAMKATTEATHRTQTVTEPPAASGIRLSLLLLFLACYALCAAILQSRSDIAPWLEAAPIEHFTVGLLWMLSLVCLLIANQYLRSRWKLGFWLAACAALAVLAMDEIFSFHERTDAVVGDDDYFKTVSWLLAGLVLYGICRMEAPPRRARRALGLGYVLHSLYIVADIGDGDYFQMPLVSIPRLRWSEEFLELFFLAAYLVGFILLYGRHIGQLSARPVRLTPAAAARDTRQPHD